MRGYKNKNARLVAMLNVIRGPHTLGEGVRPSALHIFLPLQGRGGGFLKIKILHVFYMLFHVILTFPTINGSQECRFYMFFTSAGRGGGGSENF